jgi:hypothetical protein
VQLGIYPLAILVNELMGMATVAVHLSVAVGDTSVAEQD